MPDNRSYLTKRRVPRRAFHSKVGLLISGEYHISRTWEVGEGGLMISSQVPLEKGKHIVVTYRIEGMDILVMRAVVRYILPADANGSEAKYGVQFESVDFSAKRQIRNYVASKTASENKREAA